jgi:hypothetical protein
MGGTEGPEIAHAGVVDHREIVLELRESYV